MKVSIYNLSVIGRFSAQSKVLWQSLLKYVHNIYSNISYVQIMYKYIHYLQLLPRHPSILWSRLKTDISQKPRKRIVPERTSHPVTSPPHWRPQSPLCWGRASVRCSGQWRQSTWWWWLQVQTSKRYLHQVLIHLAGESWKAITEWVNCPLSDCVLSVLTHYYSCCSTRSRWRSPRAPHWSRWRLAGLACPPGGRRRDRNHRVGELSTFWSSCFSHLRRTMVPSPGGWYLCNQSGGGGGGGSYY